MPKNTPKSAQFAGGLGGLNVRDRVKELRRVRACDLKPNPKNWRVHPASQRAALEGVLSEIGYADALIVRETPDGLILVDGHLRAETTPDQEVPVLVLDVDEAEADKILLTLDPLAAMAEAGKDQLDSLLREVDTGSEALQAMLADLAKDSGLYLTPEVVEDEVSEPPKVPVTKPGDMWLLGEHRLLCGDSTKAEDVGRLRGGRKPFIMVTDPPYGVEHDPHWREEAGVSSYGPQAKGLVTNDDRLAWTDSYKLFPGHVAYVWHAGRHATEIVVNLRDAGFEVRTQVIWRKPQIVFGRGHYHWQHEPCWYVVRSGGSAKWCGDRTQSTVWEIKSMHVMGGARNHGADGVTGHSTQKPVECMARPIRNHGGPDDDVYDPFLGSGTTIIAAEQLGRRCYGLEISPAYCDVIVERWEKFSGKKAMRG